LDGPTLTSDWSLVRTNLEENGVNLQGLYTAEVFRRVRGGLGTRNPHAYFGSFDATLDVDTKGLGAYEGGVLNLRFKHLHGSGMTAEHIGSFQTLSTLDTQPRSTHVEFWYRQEFFDGKFALKIGRQEGNVDFAASTFSASLLNNSFGVLPTLRLHTFPNWALGAAIFARPTDWLTLKYGLFDGAPDAKEPLGGAGFFRGKNGRFAIGEVQVKDPIIPSKLKGMLHIGGWYHTKNTPELPTSPSDSTSDFAVLTHNRGVYGILDQQVYQSDGGNYREVGLFLQAGWVPQDRNEARFYGGGGLAMTGLIPGRTEDVATLGVGHVEFSSSVQRLTQRHRETVLEIAYHLRLLGFWSIKPDFQYIRQPNGDQNTPDALVVGLQSTATL
jgi:porin